MFPNMNSHQKVTGATLGESPGQRSRAIATGRRLPGFSLLPAVTGPAAGGACPGGITPGCTHLYLSAEAALERVLGSRTALREQGTTASQEGAGSSVLGKLA